MAKYEIPTNPQAERFYISLAGVVYQLSLHWCAPTNCWIIDIADANGAALVDGIPVIPGADLLAQYEYLGIGGQLFAVVDGNAASSPSYDGLGTTGHIYFVTP